MPDQQPNIPINAPPAPFASQSRKFWRFLSAGDGDGAATSACHIIPARDRTIREHKMPATAKLFSTRFSTAT